MANLILLTPPISLCSSHNEGCLLQAHPFPLQLPYCRSALEGLDLTGRSPLHVAAAAGRADVVKHLLYAGCNSSKWLPADYRWEQYRQLHASGLLHQHDSFLACQCMTWHAQGFLIEHVILSFKMASGHES